MRRYYLIIISISICSISVFGQAAKSIGINMQQVKNMAYYTVGTENVNLMTISFNLGLMF